MKKSDVKTERDVLNFLSDRTDFERSVYVATYKIPEGKVSTYGRIAKRIGRPYAYRAVAHALHENPLAPVVPCHRVVRADGGFGGEKKGADSRRRLVISEGVPIEKGKVKLNENSLY